MTATAMCVPLTSCDYAGCTCIADDQIDGWAFCRAHLREHRHLKRHDILTARARGPRPLPPPDADAWLSARYSGDRRPCLSWAPLLDVMSNPQRRQVAS